VKIGQVDVDRIGLTKITAKIIKKENISKTQALLAAIRAERVD